MDQVNQLADAILALINSQPRSPTNDELVAVLTPLRAAQDIGVPRLRAEWDAVIAEMRAADAKCSAAGAGGGGLTEAVRAAEHETDRIEERVDHCARRILREPVRGPADLTLLADVVYWRRYADATVLALLKGLRILGVPAVVPND